MLRKLEYINFKLCSIKYENFVIKKFQISRLLLILYVSLNDLSALNDQVCEANTIEFFAGGSWSRKKLSEKTE